MDGLNMYQLIEKKKNNIGLTKEELYYIVEGYTKDEIPDYQMSAFLMAVCFNGMNKDEIYNFTMAMKESGEELDLSEINGVVVDKHSTGGVGDKVSLVMGPMVAACGVPVAKMSGRGLGYTGGTIDKIESFEGFNTNPKIEEFIRNVNEIGMSLAGQTANLAPADKKIYALRDVTATVDSMPLIASSIMSKKLAAGAGGIVLDVTYGSGAFMKTREEAEELGKIMEDIGLRNGRKMSVVITSMEEPLGYAVGNAIEVEEAIQVLRGHGPEDVLNVALALGVEMLLLNGCCCDRASGKEMLLETIKNGKAIEKMAQWIERQGGRKEQVFNPLLLPRAEIEKIILYKGNDVAQVKKIDAKLIGQAVQILGGGRSKKEEKIDLSVGVRLNKKVGNWVEKGDALGIIYGNDLHRINMAYETIVNAYEFQ